MSEPDDKPPAGPGESGSVEIHVSNTGLPEAVPQLDSAPVTSGKVEAAVAHEQTGKTGPTRSQRITAGVQDLVSGGVERLGAGIGTFGEGVTKIGDKMPIVGAGVSRLGEAVAKAGESIHGLPRVAQTRRGRLLVRSVVVGFLLVFSWIAVIVALQLHGNDTPDFRPDAERILVEISKRNIDKVYEEASPRFQEMVSKERFADDMTDLVTTVGAFREITAINDTLVTTGPTGRIGRLSLTAAFDKGNCHGSISFHEDHGTWKLLGIGLELPPELKITQAQREQRVAACKDPDNRKTCDVRDAAETILERIEAGGAPQVWDDATDLFKKQVTRARFIELANDNRQHTLGSYKRIISVTEAKVIAGTTATFDVLAEYEKASAVRVVFGFQRATKAAPWKLRSFKVTLPMPRAD